MSSNIVRTVRDLRVAVAAIPSECDDMLIVSQAADFSGYDAIFVDGLVLQPFSERNDSEAFEEHQGKLYVGGLDESER